MYSKPLIAFCFCSLSWPCAVAGGGCTEDRFDRPDPLAVERFGPAYRYPQAGWIVLHIEGQPYDAATSMGGCWRRRSPIF